MVTTPQSPDQQHLQCPFLMMATIWDKLLTQEPPSPHSSSAPFSPWCSWSTQRDATAVAQVPSRFKVLTVVPPTGRT